MPKPLHKEGGSAIDGRRELIDVHKGRVIHPRVNNIALIFFAKKFLGGYSPPSPRASTAYGTDHPPHVHPRQPSLTYQQDQ